MVYEIGLIVSVAVGGWLALDYLMAEDWGRRSSAIAWLGGFGALWAGAEILLAVADAPEQRALARRLLYLGVYGGTFSWYWVAVGANPPAWYARAPRRVFGLAIPHALLYSTLFWAPDGTLVSLGTERPVHGPLFLPSAMVCWALVVAGLWHYAAAAFRLGRVSRARAAALLTAFGLILATNVSYALGWIGPTDPTPAFFGLAAVMVRIGVIEPGLALYLPLARQDIVEQLAVGVLVADVDGRVIDANASARRLIGAGDPAGEDLDGVCDGLDDTIEVLRFPLRSHVAVTGHAAVLTDRREAVEAERRLNLAGRIQAVGSLTAGMAHEVNNPLAFVRANLNLIEKLIAELVSPVVNARLPRHVRALALDGAESLIDAKDGIDRISMLVARLKDFAGQTSADADRRAPVDVGEAARRAVALAGVGVPAGAIRLGTSAATRVVSDEPTIVQILVNLVLNAVQAGGERASVDVDVIDHPSEVEIRVSDHGPGLDPEALARIFDPFFTTKASGSGLGLPVSYELARQLGGRLEAANRPEGGARFGLFLPR